MKRIIHHLRKQPEEARRHILHILTIVAAVILALLWIYSLGQGIKSGETEANIKEGLQPFSAIKENTVEGYKSMLE